MDTHRMKCFLRLAEELHFSRAAEKQCMAQSTMSQQIHNLEEELRTKLFVRNNRKVQLTAAGEYLKEEFTRLLDSYEAVTKEARRIDGHGINNLAIGYHGPFNWLFLTSIFLTFKASHPEIRFTLMMENWGEIPGKIMTKEIDLGFVESSEIDDDNLHIQSSFLARDYICFALHKSHPLAGRTLLREEDIRKESLAMVDLSIGKRSIGQIHQRLIQGGIDIRKGQLMKNFESIMAMVATGVAISPMPRSFKQSYQDDIVFIDYDSTDAYVDISMAWLKDNKSQALLSFVEHLKTTVIKTVTSINSNYSSKPSVKINSGSAY